MVVTVVPVVRVAVQTVTVTTGAYRITVITGHIGDVAKSERGEQNDAKTKHESRACITVTTRTTRITPITCAFPTTGLLNLGVFSTNGIFRIIVTTVTTPPPTGDLVPIIRYVPVVPVTQVLPVVRYVRVVPVVTIILARVGL